MENNGMQTKAMDGPSHSSQLDIHVHPEEGAVGESQATTNRWTHFTRINRKIVEILGGDRCLALFISFLTMFFEWERREWSMILDCKISDFTSLKKYEIKRCRRKAKEMELIEVDERLLPGMGPRLFYRLNSQKLRPILDQVYRSDIQRTADDIGSGGVGTDSPHPQQTGDWEHQDGDGQYQEGNSQCPGGDGQSLPLGTDHPHPSLLKTSTKTPEDSSASRTSTKDDEPAPGRRVRRVVDVLAEEGKLQLVKELESQLWLPMVGSPLLPDGADPDPDFCINLEEALTRLKETYGGQYDMLVAMRDEMTTERTREKFIKMSQRTHVRWYNSAITYLTGIAERLIDDYEEE